MALILSGTDGLSDVDGSAATPAIRGTDTNTGIFFPAADTIAFSEGGAEVGRFDSSGNLGIGTSSPQKKLAVSNNGAAGLELDPFTRSGTTGASLLAYNRSGAAFVRMDYDASEHLFFTSGTERARIDSSGNLLVGQTSYTNPPTSQKDIQSGGLWLNPTFRTAANAANTYWETATGVFYRSTSSIRYKANVQDYERGLSDVLKLRPVTYNSLSNDTTKLFAGFIAEDIDAIGMKEFVEYDSQERPDSLAYANMTALLTKAIQEQQAIIQSLTARIEALEGKA